MILISPFDLIAVLFALVFAYPWALMLLPREGRSWLLLILTTLALSVGGLTLEMMLLALLKLLTVRAVLIGLLLVFVSGAAWLYRTQSPQPSLPPSWFAQHTLTAARRNPLAAAAVLIAAGIAGLILLNDLYWPFGDPDAVSIYALQARQIYRGRALLTGEGLYEAYPMQVQLSYVYSYLIAGDVQEYLARLFPAVLAAGTLGAAAALGRTLYDRRTGLAATVLLALTPTFSRWAPTGYTDVPAAFFFTLAVLFSWRMAQDGDPRTAILAGIMAGLAAWTKNSALTITVSLAVWLIYARRCMGAKITARLAGWALGALALTAGPWYLRNVLLFGHVIPKTVWTDQAVRTVENFFPFIRFPSRFFVAGLLFTLGLGWTILEGLTNHRDRHDRARLLLIYLLPFAAAWWWMASYDTRFLLTVLPLVAVMGAHVLIEGWDRLWGGRPLRPAVQIVLGVLLIGLALPSARTALIFKGDMLRHPLMSDATRHRIRLGPAYDVALYLNAIPAEGLILTDSQSLAPHVEPAQVVVGGLSSRDQLAHYRYLVLSNSNPLPDFVQPGDVSLLTEIGGFRVYRVDYRG